MTTVPMVKHRITVFNPIAGMYPSIADIQMRCDGSSEKNSF
jgi:hypothetical protein